ncbi:MAG: twin-arginine translocation signal domain-containing protein, partial [bacterium]
MDRRDFITASGVAALSAAAITPSKAGAHSPATITATLEN